MILCADWNVPADIGLRKAQRLCEQAEDVQYVMLAGRDAFIDEQAVAFFGTPGVVADAPLGRDHRRNQVGTQRQLHLQQDVETPAGELLGQLFDAFQPGFLVEDDQLDAIQSFHQLGFAFAEDPGDAASGQVALQGADQGQHMRGVAQGGKA
jgi:hypothetical protein